MIVSQNSTSPDSSPLEKLLEAVVRDRRLHAKWLNTFSMLEYIGFRKIVKSQSAEDLTENVLQHAFEESRHALLLKKIARKLGAADSYTEDAVFCGRAAVTYFQTLDAACSEDFQAHSTKMTYLYVTWLVELRALEVYEAHRRAAVQATDVDCQVVASQLARLLREEEGHLRDVEMQLAKIDPHFGQRSLKFKNLEKLLFATFLQAASNELKASGSERLDATHEHRSAQGPSHAVV